MEKYIAFGLYQKNDVGGHQPVRATFMLGDEVYLAADTDKLVQALHQIRNGCVDDGDEANETFRLAPQELRAIAEKALGLSEGEAQ